ncbi:MULTISPECIES: Ycf66 family protein [Aerosakkonema]|uniref:Ycf66 family protein n=1 Tax=Aerosakkonema TaxID=1246629 RepID=UPI0035BAD376
MLTYILALAVGLGSLGIYLAAFFLPEVHRKSDFYWSGIGLFYALMLWVCAGRITGGVLIGQIAGVALLGWFGWQTLTLRRQLTPVDRQTEIPSGEVAAEKVLAQVDSLKGNLQSKFSNVSVPQGVSQLPQRIGGLFASAKNQVQARLSAPKKPKAKPTVVKTQPPSRPVAPGEALDADLEAEAIAPGTPTVETPQTDWQAWVTTSTPPAETLKTYPEADSAESSNRIENIAPEIEIAPPAEPLGIGDPADRKSSASDISDATAYVPSQPSPAGDIPELKRPHPPSPEVVEEATGIAEKEAGEGKGTGG